MAKGSAIGGFGGGWLEHPRQRLGAQWPGLLPWECRAAQSRQARLEEAQESSSGTAEGSYDPAGLQEGLVVRRGYVRLGGDEHARGVHVVALGELHEAVDREAASVERVHHAALEEQHHRHRGDAEAPGCQKAAESATLRAVARAPEAVTGHPVDRDLPVGVGAPGAARSEGGTGA